MGLFFSISCLLVVSFLWVLCGDRNSNFQHLTQDRVWPLFFWVTWIRIQTTFHMKFQMRAIFFTLLIFVLTSFQTSTTRQELCELLQMKLEAKSIHIKPSKIECDRFGNIDMYFTNSESPDQKIMLNLFDVTFSVKQIEYVNGEKPFTLSISCKVGQCITCKNWGRPLNDQYWDHLGFDFYEISDANYVSKSLVNIKAKCVIDPNK
ncbi:hypothetical protein BH09BAC5_BH09BAC5_10490 [soil metagenome]